MSFGYIPGVPGRAILGWSLGVKTLQKVFLVIQKWSQAWNP
jgi:hypothetical protein